MTKEPHATRRRGLLAAALAVCSLTALLAEPALVAARRPATSPETSAIAMALPATRPACINATISTVDPDWALEYGLLQGHCPRGDGFEILRKQAGGEWTAVYGASDTSARCGQLKIVPSAVARDLKACNSEIPYTDVRNAGGICYAIPVDDATSADLHAAHQHALASNPRLKFTGPTRVRLGACDSTEYALATFRDSVVGVTDQPEMFRRRSDGQWRDLGDGGSECAALRRAFPDALLRLWHLGRCVKPTVPRLICNGGSDGRKLIRSIKPRTCGILPGDASFAEGVMLDRMHWRSWSTNKAVGVGASQGMHAYGPYITLRVLLDRPRRACGNGSYTVFTRVRVTTKYGTSVVKPETCA